MTEPELAGRRRRRSRPSPSRRRSAGHSRVRFLFFSLAAIWGFIAGSAAVLGALAADGRPHGLESRMLGVLGLAGLLAVAGGLVVARAYRETVRNR